VGGATAPFDSGLKKLLEINFEKNHTFGLDAGWFVAVM
jgi:hypothetical protein